MKDNGRLTQPVTEAWDAENIKSRRRPVVTPEPDMTQARDWVIRELEKIQARAEYNAVLWSQRAQVAKGIQLTLDR